MAPRRHQPPSRQRWQARHRVITAHVTKDDYERAEALIKQKGQTLAALLREAVGLQAAGTGAAYEQGRAVGRQEALGSCAHCREAIEREGFDEWSAKHRLVAPLTNDPGGVPQEAPADLFAAIEGHDGPKRILSLALQSPKPVHVLLVGPPGTGKTQLLQCLAGLPGGRYAVGGATTSSGLVAYLLERPETRYLVIDELDKADPADLYALYSLMESGVVTRLQHQAHEYEKRSVAVFAAANDATVLPQALASRFVRIDFPAYSVEQTQHIAYRALLREGLPAARAEEIARATAARSRDPRDGVQVGRLAGGRRTRRR